MPDGEYTYPILPKRGVPAIYCKWCYPAREIEAFEGVTILGLEAGYRWRHRDDQSTTCSIERPRTRPYDEFEAGARLRTVEAHDA